MNIARFESRYRPTRSANLLGRLLQETEFDRMLSNGEPDVVTDWLPAVDIQEDGDRFVLKADLPGVDPENIDVTMEDGVLTIQGSRESETATDDDNYRRYERVSGKFLRRFTLPDTANGEAISAATKHGVLEVSIPKQARPSPRKINVQPA